MGPEGTNLETILDANLEPPNHQILATFGPWVDNLETMLRQIWSHQIIKFSRGDIHLFFGVAFGFGSLRSQLV